MLVFFMLAVAVLLFGSALWVDRRRRGTWSRSGRTAADDAESKFYNPYDQR